MPNPSQDPSPFPPSRAADAAAPAARRSLTTVLDVLANVVAEAYVDERRRWTRAQAVQEQSRFSIAKWLPAFRKLAKQFVDEQTADYRTYLHVQFESRASKHIAPTPQQCYGPAAKQKWALHARNREPVEQQLAVALKIQRATFDLAVVAEGDMGRHAKPPWTKEQVLGSVLCNPGHTLSYLFRYGAARAANLPRVAAEFRDAAYHQYLFARGAYDAVWGNMVPADLRSEADQAMLDLQDAAGAHDAE
jgi:hypothetical protein